MSVVVNHEVSIYTCGKCGRTYGVSSCMDFKNCPYCEINQIRATMRDQISRAEKHYNEVCKLRRQLGSLRGQLTKLRKVEL